MNVVKKLEALRNLMKKNNIDAYLIDDADNHASEYVNEYYKERSYMSSFLGSNGKLLVLMDKAYLWTDGRYFLEAEKSLENTTIELMKMTTPGYPSLMEYLKENLSNKVIGLYGDYFQYEFVKSLSFASKVVTTLDLVNEVWDNRGSLETKEIWSLGIEYTGETTPSKIERIREYLTKKNATALFLSNIDDIAWTFNLRGGDVPITPVFLSFAYITIKESYIFLNINKLNNDAKKALEDANTKVYEYERVKDFLKEVKNERIISSFKETNYSFINSLKDENILIDLPSPTVLFKAIKNETEIRNNIDVHKADGLAIFRFMKYIKEEYEKGTKMDEYNLSLKVLEYRKMDKRFYEVSFDTICAWNSNGAIIHYEPTKDKYSDISGSGLLLLDSGGQYMGGTTDITRTYKLGDITDEMKHLYTVVLKAHINVSMAKFIKGTTGVSIDMLARFPFWNEGLDYKHGTGHGVGYMLNVHESPNNFRYQANKNTIESSIIYPGMITSNEPGIYLKDKFGVRIENEVLCIKNRVVGLDEFYSFDTITYAPYDLDCINKEELSIDQIKWLNDYHKNVREVLSKFNLTQDEIEYLNYVTREI